MLLARPESVSGERGISMLLARPESVSGERGEYRCY